MNTEARDRYLADFVRVAPTLPGSRAPWVDRARRSALERFEQTGFPSKRDEEWKYTSVAAIENRPFIALPNGVSTESVTVVEVDALAFGGFAGHLLVFVNGRHSSALSAVGRLPTGVTLGSLAAVLERNPDALEPFLLVDRHQTVFGALNMAFMADGAYLHVPRGVAVEEPIHLLYIATAESSALFPRNLIVADAGAKAMVIEHYAGREGVAYFTNAVTQIFAAESATVEHCKLQQEALQGIHIGGIHAAQCRDSSFVSHSMAFGASLARNDVTTAFDAEGCTATLNGLYMVGGRQHVDHHTRIDHAKPNGKSREFYRGVLDGASHGVFNGKVIVHPGAQRTDAQQANHNLLLSRDAEADTKPQLEIYADDVKCTHGATVGRLDDAQIFYLRSRGVDEPIARTLLTYAFAQDVIDRIRVAPVRAHLEQLLLSRLPQGQRIKELA